MENSRQINNKGFPLNQVIAALVCNFGSLNCGMAVGWMSPALPQLLAPDGILSRLPAEEAFILSSWLAAIFPIGAFCMTPFAAYFVDHFGKKKAGILTGIPFMINGILILFGDDIQWLLIGRFFMGIGASMNLATTPSYIGEISSPSIRGRLASVLMVAYTIGISLSYAVGGFVCYRAAAVMMILSALMGVILFNFMPETPAHLYRIGEHKKAANSIAWLNKCDINDDIVTEGLEKLRLSRSKNEKQSVLTTIKSIVFQKHHRRGLWLCMCTAVFQGCMGMVAVHSFSVSIFMESGAGNLTPEAASLIYGSIQIMGAISAASLADKWGRKALLACSSFGVSISMMSMAAYFTLKMMNIDTTCLFWMPVAALSSCVYIYTVGAGPVPFILLSDLLTSEIRSFGIMVSVQIQFVFMFLTLRFFGPVTTFFGPHILFYFFSICASLSGIWTLMVLPETRGKSVEDIKALLSK